MWPRMLSVLQRSDLHILVGELKGSDLRPGDTTSSFAKFKPTLLLAGFSSSCTACPGETEFANNLAFIEPLRQSNRGQNVPLLTLHEEKKGGFGVPQSLPSDMTDNPSSSREREDKLLHSPSLSLEDIQGKKEEERME